MAKLPKKVADQVNNAEGGSFEALPEGRYLAKLLEVDTTRVGQTSGNPYWSWEFGELRNLDLDGKSAPGKQWVNTSLAENAFWKLKEVFNAFGYDADTDTDELIGQECVLVVTQRTIEAGARKGEIGNNVDRCLPYEADDSDDEEGF